jgi:hypothetical protein
MDSPDQLTEHAERKASRSEVGSVNLNMSLHSEIPPKKVSNKIELIKKKFYEIFQESTTHGIPNILHKDNIYLRIFWFILLLVSIGFCAYLIIKAILDYLNFDVTSKIRLVNESPMTYPMISICNTNPFITKFAKEYFAAELTKMVNLSDQDLEILYGNSSNPNDRVSFISRFTPFVYTLQSKVADPNFNETIRKQFGFTQSQLLLMESFGTFLDPTDYDYTFNDFVTTYYDPNYGNCFRFNSGFLQNGEPIPLLKQHQPGRSHGLFIVAFVDVLDNQKLFNFMDFDNTFGLKISIQNQSYLPMSYESMLPLKTGTCTNIALKKTIAEMMPKPYSACTDVDSFDSPMIDEFRKLNKTYQQNACFEMCKQKYFIEKCNCSMTVILNYNGHRTCSTFEEYTCSTTFDLDHVLSELSRSQKLNCPLECVSSKFTYMNSYEAFPNPGIMSDILRSHPAVQEHFRAYNKSPDDISHTDLRNSLVCFNVYLDDLQYTHIDEAPSVDIVGLLANIGGLLGLFIGKILSPHS